MRDERLISSRFLRASRYHPDWVLAAVSGAANPLWLTEWLAEAMDLRPGMRVLDLGCGRALSSVFLHRLPDGWRFWRDWLKLIAPANEQEISAVETDAGRHFGYVRAVGRRRADAQLFDAHIEMPAQYTKQPLLREEAK
jgi:hypothetical protein